MESYDKDRKKAWEDLEVSRDELKQLTECMKRPEFRELLREYAEEVSDPANRQLYETEMIQLERERGYDIKFVHPEPGYVIKTSLDGSIKCFINVAKSELVDKPTSKRPIVVDNQQQPGLNWSIPYIIASPRDDLDNNKQRCRVFDVVFHPDAIYLALRNKGFKTLLDDTALDGVENNFKVKLDRKNIRFPKINFKGVSQPTVIRKPCEKPIEKLDIEPEIYQKLMSSYDEVRSRNAKTRDEKPKRESPTIKYFNSKNTSNDELIDSEYTTPKFIVKHQSYLDMDEFRETKDAKMNATVPKNLIIEVNLPLLKSASDAVLDVQERQLLLKSETPAKYRLDLPLSYRVDPDQGSAKFDAKVKKLTVTLPVITNSLNNDHHHHTDATTKILTDGKEDSGVESDQACSPVPESQLSDENKNTINSSESVQNFLNSDESIVLKTDCSTDEVEFSSNPTSHFLDPNVKYCLPAFTCNVYEGVLAITVHSKNVEPDSIRHKILDDQAGLHVILTSIGSGYFPVYYSLCLKIGNERIVAESLAIEPWDNNVVLSIKIKNAETLTQYFAGINEDDLEIKDLTAAASIQNKLQELEQDAEPETDKNVEVIRSDNEITVNVNRQNAYTDDDEDEDANNDVKDRNKRNFNKTISISESSGDELPSSVGSNNGSSDRLLRYKSILKSQQFSRSVSESSFDESSNTAPLSLITTFNDSACELMSKSEGSSLKKTVRFNNVVSQQLYRSNSSILGQRKKNQRKLRNKKRAHDRRMSESENSETDEREKYKVEQVKKDTENVESTVRRPPILHHQNNNNNNNSTDTLKTAIIEIDCKQRRGGNNKRKHKRGTDTKSVDKIKTEQSHSEEESFDTKNDLMFDLEV